MFAQQGYLVVSIDNRGTRVPKGRAWRKSVYRKIGIIAPQEQAAATRVLLKQWPFADPNRIGIWGWSGGGSMSLNAIFRYPDLYHTAMAVAPVPNQLLYDTIYQERYMGLPSDNADGYRTGSPITYAKHLKGNLLIVHGTGDDNCHYQGTELLVNELIAQNKQFTIMPYPSRTHSVSEGRNTTRHLYSMLTRYLNQHVPPGGVPINQEKPDCGSAEESISWMTRTIEGWTVNINPMLLKQSKPALDRAMQLLTLQLKEIVRVVPKQAVQDLRKVPLWFSPVYPNTRPRAEYHPNINWLRMNGRDPAMAKGVEFSNVSIFEQETRRMPNFALHELSHAYHDQILGFGHKQILSTFEQAKAGGKYERVLRQNAQGQKRIDRAYAITNHKEYFAESTEAFFSRNDFFPFDRAQLRKHDPQMHNLLKGIWGND
jgi:dipeptidyl-peptidase-4